MVPTSLYRFIWQISRRQQIQICLLTLFIAPLTAAPLELQRRIVNTAIGQHSLQTLFWLAAAYLGVLLVQGGLKYAMNVIKGLVLEEITRALRLRMVTMLSAISRLAAKKRQKAPDEGTIVSIIAAESRGRRLVCQRQPGSAAAARRHHRLYRRISGLGAAAGRGIGGCHLSAAASAGLGFPEPDQRIVAS